MRLFLLIFLKVFKMKSLFTIVLSVFALTSFAAEPAKKDEKKVEAKPAVTAPAASAPKEQPNCVTKDKKGNCPPAPKSEKPTPKKKIEDKKADEKK